MVDVNDDFRNSCRSGKTYKVKELLDNPDLDPMACDEYMWNGLDYACNNGHLEIVRLLLLDPRIDPSETENFALARAIFGERYNSNGETDNNSFSNRKCIDERYPEIVRLMLQDGRCSIPTWIAEIDYIRISEPVKQILDQYIFRLDGPIYNQNII
uniref:Ankyrin repeat protein n=1 Tax=viral metagenome TaxID=1070528 RepID=A0A6C0JTH7_9ZZZZ